MPRFYWLHFIQGLPHAPLSTGANQHTRWSVSEGICVGAKSLQSCSTLCEPVNCSPPGFSVHGILQARMLEWIAMPSSRGFFETQGSNLHFLHWQAGSLALAPSGKPYRGAFAVVQWLSHVWLCNPMNCSTPGFPVFHCLPEFAQTCVHWVGDATQPFHPLLLLSPLALSLSQQQGLFQWGSFHVLILILLSFTARPHSTHWKQNSQAKKKKQTLMLIRAWWMKMLATRICPGWVPQFHK